MEMMNSNPSPSFAGKLSVLPESFYQQDTVTVAQQLLGTYLVLEDATSTGIRKVGRISETEAYVGIGDKASHSNKGITPRTQTLFGAAGTIYVYLIYGMYHCLNVVTDTPESGGAVLVRAVEPVEGLEGKTSGPGLLCKAYGIDRSHNGQSIVASRLTIQKDLGTAIVPFTAHSRVGIDYAGEDKDRLYRFRIAN
jgi:DNA-3-methyladenine glycosylase